VWLVVIGDLGKVFPSRVRRCAVACWYQRLIMFQGGLLQIGFITSKTLSVFVCRCFSLSGPVAFGALFNLASEDTGLLVPPTPCENETSNNDGGFSKGMLRGNRVCRGGERTSY
jgi:hypothetical protein